MKTSELQAVIDAAFEERAAISIKTKGKVRGAVEAALDLLDQGRPLEAQSGA